MVKTAISNPSLIHIILCLLVTKSENIWELSFDNEYKLPNLCGYYEPHLPLKFKRSTFEKVWEKESQILTETTATRFRDKSNVNLWLFRYWQLATGEFVPKERALQNCLGATPSVFLALLSQIHH